MEEIQALQTLRENKKHKGKNQWPEYITQERTVWNSPSSNFAVTGQETVQTSSRQMVQGKAENSKSNKKKTESTTAAKRTRTEEKCSDPGRPFTSEALSSPIHKSNTETKA